MDAMDPMRGSSDIFLRRVLLQRARHKRTSVVAAPMSAFNAGMLFCGANIGLDR